MGLNLCDILSIERSEQIAEPGHSDEELKSNIGPQDFATDHDGWDQPRLGIAPMIEDLRPVIANSKLSRVFSRFIECILIASVYPDMSQRNA
jgi:hypothetical protein